MMQKFRIFVLFIQIMYFHFSCIFLVVLQGQNNFGLNLILEYYKFQFIKQYYHV